MSNMAKSLVFNEMTIKEKSKMSLAGNCYKRPDINKLRLGDLVRMPMSHQGGLVPQEGTVVYIHPKLRFFTLEFTGDNYRIRESYCAYGPEH